MVWHGHTADLARLVEAAEAHCSCRYRGGADGTSPSCSTHQIFADQHTLDHLAFARSVLKHLIDEEWRVPVGRAESQSERAEWSAFLQVCTSAREPAPIRVQRQARAPRAAALGPWVVSLLALVLMLGVHGPGGDTLPITPPIAGWQTR